jgi:transposase
VIADLATSKPATSADMITDLATSKPATSGEVITDSGDVDLAGARGEARLHGALRVGATLRARPARRGVIRGARRDRDAAEEAQVDYGDGPMVRDAITGKYRRVRPFLLTLAHSRKAVRLLTEKSSTEIWARLHEQAFRRLGGATATVVLDNLRAGVLKPDIYDPLLNPQDGR